MSAQRKSKQRQVERIAGRIAKALHVELALMALVGRKLTRLQRRRIHSEICRRSKAVLLG